MTVGQLLRSCSSRELAEWEALAGIDAEANTRASLDATVTANLAARKG